MIYRIAVCDDRQTDRDYLDSLLNEWAASVGHVVQTQLFPSAEAFLFCYEEDKSWDMLLLDIEMDGMDGVTLAKKIRRDNRTVQLIFVTGYSEYISEGYEVSALHYLMKPIRKEKLFAVLDRAAELCVKNGRFLTLEQSKEMIRLPLYEIRYLEASQNYVTIHGEKGQNYTIRHTLSELERELDDRFFRTGRSYIVNLACIRKVTRTDIHLKDGELLPLPRGMYKALNQAIISRL